MPLPKPTFDVELDGHPDLYRVEITPGDQMRAEREAGRFGIRSPKAEPMTTTAAWIYLALLRTGRLTDATKWAEFRDETLTGWEPVKNVGTTTDDGTPVVDPTQPAAPTPSP